MSRPLERPATIASRGMVATSHPLASTVGVGVLAGGGNAIDAALAAAAITWLTLPGQCGIGGDAFAVVREPDGRVWTVAGSGFGPDGGTPDYYRELGHSAIPIDGALAVAVPGAIAALATLHSGGATRSLRELWEDAALLAERGVPCSAKTRDDVAEKLGQLQRDNTLRSAFTDGGRVPLVGSRRPQPDLAATIRALAADPSTMYRGEIAERCVAALTDAGAPFSGDEWALCADVRAEDAITGRYAGATVHQTPLPSAGWMVLQQAALCDRRLGLVPWLSADAIDRMARAARLAFEDRFDVCGSDNSGAAQLLDSQSIARRRAQIDGADPGPPREFSVAGGDTTSLVVVDGDGRSVSLIHSLAFTFGAGYTVPGTGIALNNRLGRGAYLIAGHPNEVRPRRKPLHTLNAWIATDDAGELLAVGNTPGGDGQIQWNMQLLSHLLDHGLDPQEAVSAPRFTVFPGADADVIGAQPELRIEETVSETTRNALTDIGHEVRVLDVGAAGGSAQVISRDARGFLLGGSDPRQEGVALGIE